jgi:hypothetical protein
LSVEERFPFVSFEWPLGRILNYVCLAHFWAVHVSPFSSTNYFRWAVGSWCLVYIDITFLHKICVKIYLISLLCCCFCAGFPTKYVVLCYRKYHSLTTWSLVVGKVIVRCSPIFFILYEWGHSKEKLRTVSWKTNTGQIWITDTVM